MAHHEPCDTFFVEDAHTQRNPRDYARMVSSRRSENMANELSRQASETYLDDIVDHMNFMEVETLPDVASIDIQQEIQWFMRPYLIDFLIEAHAAFQLLPETLFLAVNILDRYCSKRVVYKRHYQLVGCASLLIAAKYGDRKERVPMIRELKSMCCSLYDEDMFTQMEWHVLNTLEWMVGHPTVDSFLQIALHDRAAYEDVEVEHMSWYLCEIAMYHKDFVSKKSSTMARASLALARNILGRHDDYDGRDFDVSDVIVKLSIKIRSPSAVLFRKYTSPHLSQVANILEHTIQQQDAINRRASPPTPPCESVMEKSMQASEIYPGTPQKQSYGHMAHGYMTPPITPEGEYFVGDNKGYQQAPRCPVTPTPSGNTLYPQAQYHHYHQEISMH